MDYLFALFLVLLFVAVSLLLEGLLLWWNTTRGPEAQRVARRVRLMSAGGPAATGSESLLLKKRLLAEAPLLASMLLQLPRVHALDRLLEQSGSSWSVGRFLGWTVLAWAGGFLLARLFLSALPFELAAACAAATLPTLHVLRLRDKRLRRFEELLPEALDLMGRALRAGHAFPSALKMVGEEMSEPIGSEFKITFDEVNFGIAMPTALTNLAVRVPSMDLRYFVIAVLIHREAGGNLSEILGNISQIIRDRLQLLGKIRVLSAEGRLSAWILGLLPFCTAAVINLLNPQFMSVLWIDPVGRQLLAGTGLMILAGLFWMRKIIRIHV